MKASILWISREKVKHLYLKKLSQYAYSLFEKENDKQKLDIYIYLDNVAKCLKKNKINKIGLNRKRPI